MWRSLLPYFFGKKIVLIVCLKIVLKQIVNQILTGVACDLYSAGPDLLKAGTILKPSLKSFFYV